VPAVVPDTSVLILIWHDSDLSLEIARREWLFRLSAVVHSELQRGAHERRVRRLVDQVARVETPIAPTANQWKRCGEILARLGRDHHFDARGMQLIQNDLLIGLTARDLGVPVVTANVRDFQLIAAHLRGLRVIEFPVAS